MYQKIMGMGKLHCQNVLDEDQDLLRTVQVKGYICLSENGEYIHTSAVKQAISIPYLGSLMYNARQANEVIEKRGIIFDEDSADDKDARKAKRKHPSYMAGLEDGSKHCVCLNHIYQFLLKFKMDEEFAQRIRNDMKACQIKMTDYVSFMIDGKKLESDLREEWFPWFKDRYQMLKSVSSNTGTSDLQVLSCLSGEIQSVKTKGLPVIRNIEDSNVSNAFGLGKPGYFAAADKQSYESYGFDGALGFQSGEEDLKWLVAGMEYLLNHKEHHDINFRLVYFYSNDALENIIQESLMFSDDEDDEDMVDEELEKSESYQNILKKVMQSAYTGEMPDFAQFKTGPFQNAKFHMCSFNCLSGRCFLSNVHESSYVELVESLYQWYRDTAIVKNHQIAGITKLYAVLLSCTGKKEIKKQYECVDKEMSSMKEELLASIYFGKPFPMFLYVKALEQVECTFVRKQSNGNGEEKVPLNIRMIHAQILKCYLIRKGYHLMADLQTDGSVNIAYDCGRLFASYEQAQYIYNRENGKELNKNLAQCYFASAMKNPGVIFPHIAKMSNVYLNGMSKSVQIWLYRLIGEMVEKIGPNFPKTFNTDEQGSFALGYYQQKSVFLQKKESEDD